MNSKKLQKKQPEDFFPFRADEKVSKFVPQMVHQNGKPKKFS